MEKTMRIRMIITMQLLMATVVVSAQGLKTTVDEDRKAEIRKVSVRTLVLVKFGEDKIFF